MRGSGSELGRSSFPSLNQPGGFPESPLALCCTVVALGVSGKGQLWATGTETRGGLFSQRHFLAAWGAPAHTSLMLGRAVMLSTPTCFPWLIPHSVCRDEGKGWSWPCFQITSHPLHPATPWFQTCSEARPAASRYLLKSSTEVHCSWLQ